MKSLEKKLINIKTQVVSLKTRSKEIQKKLREWKLKQKTLARAQPKKKKVVKAVVK